MLGDQWAVYTARGSTDVDPELIIYRGLAGRLKTIQWFHAAERQNHFMGNPLITDWCSKKYFYLPLSNIYSKKAII